VPGLIPFDGMAICQCSGVRDLTTANRDELSGRNGHHRSRLSGQGDKLDLVSLIPWIEVPDRSFWLSDWVIAPRRRTGLALPFAVG
jgi:hypothetical protein